MCPMCFKLVIKMVFKSIEFLRGIFFFLNRFYRQSRRIQPLLHRFKQDFWQNEPLSDDLWQRMQRYATLMPVAVGDLYCLLRGYPMSAREREMQDYLSLFTPVYDEWFDNQSLKHEAIQPALFNPINFIPTNKMERLSLTLLQRLHALVPKTVQWQTIATQLTQAQAESNRQTILNLPTSELSDIMFKKGGYALWMTRLFLEHPLSTAEEKVVMQMGGLFQFLDDILDLREDYIAGVHTLVTETTDIQLLTKTYQLEIQKLFDLAALTDFPQKAQVHFKNRVQLAFGIGLIALKQLYDAQLKYGGPFDASKLTRQELVCDMQRPISYWKWYQAFLN
jgi:hypothetical protein